MRLTPCAETFFTDLPFPERIGRIKQAGFDACEFWAPDGKDIPAVARACRDLKMAVTSIAVNTRGLWMTDPATHEKVAEILCETIAAAKLLNCRKLIVLCGNVRAGVTREEQCMAIVAGLRRLAPIAEKAGMTLLLEYLNTHRDHPGYFLDSFCEMSFIIRCVNHPNVRALLDIYHAGVMEGNMIEKIRATMDTIGHFHAAGIPGRHEMKDGEQNYPAICRAIDAAGYDGYLGLEYFPLKDSMQSLIETREWLAGK